MKARTDTKFDDFIVVWAREIVSLQQLFLLYITHIHTKSEKKILLLHICMYKSSRHVYRARERAASLDSRFSQQHKQSQFIHTMMIFREKVKTTTPKNRNKNTNEIILKIIFF